MQDKFRVWCKNKNEWEKDPVMLAPDGVLYTEYKGRWIPVKADTHIVEFSTGLHAAKSYRGESEADRLAFEGDVVRVIYLDNGEQCCEERPVTWNYDVCGYMPMGYTQYCENCDASTEIKSIEIIGTIFDIPEGKNETN